MLLTIPVEHESSVYNTLNLCVYCVSVHGVGLGQVGFDLGWVECTCKTCIFNIMPGGLNGTTEHVTHTMIVVVVAIV